MFVLLVCMLYVRMRMYICMYCARMSGNLPNLLTVGSQYFPVGIAASDELVEYGNVRPWQAGLACGPNSWVIYRACVDGWDEGIQYV